MDPSKFSKAIKPLSSTLLDLPPSCIEFVPGYAEFFVVGTYNLQKDVDTDSLAQSRTGSLNLLRIVGSELTLKQTLSHPSAILDLHFLPNSSKFGVVSSTGTVSIYTFQPSSQEISHIITHQAFDPSLLALSFAWYPTPQSSPLLAATLSNGSLHLLRFTSDLTHLESLNDSEPLNAHSLEAWTCAFALTDPSKPRIRIYSGGDDAKLRLVELEPLSPDIKADEEIPIVQTIPQSIFKGHEAGVTAILPLPVPDRGGESQTENLLLTGSYDDYVRVYTAYDTRSNAPNTTGKSLAALKIGGGVWRLKFLDGIEQMVDTEGSRSLSYRVLASCMHAGARVLEVKRAGKDDEWRIEILGSVTVHESMCYGSDVQPFEDMAEEERERVCVSTSFYDRLVCVWRFDPKAI